MKRIKKSLRPETAEGGCAAPCSTKARRAQNAQKTVLHLHKVVRRIVKVRRFRQGFGLRQRAAQQPLPRPYGIHHFVPCGKQRRRRHSQARNAFPRAAAEREQRRILGNPAQIHGQKAVGFNGAGRPRPMRLFIVLRNAVQPHANRRPQRSHPKVNEQRRRKLKQIASRQPIECPAITTFSYRARKSDSAESTWSSHCAIEAFAKSCALPPCPASRRLEQAQSSGNSGSSGKK